MGPTSHQRGGFADSGAGGGDGDRGSGAGTPHVVSRSTFKKTKKFSFDTVGVRMPSGKTIERDVVKHPGAVVIVPVLGDGQVIIERIYRAALDAWAYEFPAGTIDEGESPEQCARRELIEEAGHKAGTLRPLGVFRTTPGLTDERMHAYVASDLAHVGQKLEEDETLELHTLSPDEVGGLIASGTMQDAKSVLAFWLAQRAGLLGGKGPGCWGVPERSGPATSEGQRP